MPMSLLDRLPMDEGDKKFLGPVNPQTEEFALFWAMQAQEISSKDYAFLGVLTGYNTNTVFDSDSVGTSPVKQGDGGSSTNAVDARGFNRVTAFVTVSGLADGESIVVRLWRRLTQTGSDFSPAGDVADALGNGDNAVVFGVDCPYFMLEAEASAGTATVTLVVYLHRD
jgi:hypothetical protein